jgi:hypothetical protein
MSFAPCRLRLCPAPMSPFGSRCSEPCKTKLVRAWPHGPRAALPPRSTSPLPGRELPLARPSLMSAPPALPPTTCVGETGIPFL